MVTMLKLHLPSKIVVVGCEINPYVLLWFPHNTIINDDISTYVYYLRYKWYHVQSDKNVGIYTVHPLEETPPQCLYFLRDITS